MSNNLDPMARARQAISMLAETALVNAQAVCVAAQLNPVDVGLGVARGLLEGVVAMVPVGENPDRMPRDIARLYRAAQAGLKAIREELGRVIEVASVVPLNGRS